MASISGKPFEQAETAVQGFIEGMIEKAIKRRVTKLESAAVRLQSNFLKYLAVSAGVIGADKAPTFSGIDFEQPRFKPLSTNTGANAKADRVAKIFGTKSSKAKKSYLDRKHSMGLPGNSFFYYKGKLQNYLLSTGNPIGLFGKPNVFFTEFGRGGSFRVYSSGKGQAGIVKLSGIFTASGNASKRKSFQTSNRIGKISVDLFPKLRGNLSLSQTAEDLGFPRTMAYRLDNFHGGQDRQFMPQYIQWWVRSKGRDMMRKANNQQ